MAQIEKRGDNRWQVRVFLGRDANGRRQFHTHTVQGTKKDATAYAAKVQHELSTKTFVEPTKLTLDQYLDQWLDVIKSTLSPRSYDDCCKKLKRYIRPELGHHRLHQLTTSHIQAVYAGMLTRGLSARTVVMAHAALRPALKHAVTMKMLAVTPTTGVKLPKVSRQELRIMDSTEAARFVQACALDHWGILFTFSLITGMRPGEVLALRWKDVNFSKHLVRVQRALVSLGKEKTFREPKTAQSRRTIIIPPDLTDMLLEHQQKQQEERQAAGANYQDFDLVFATAVGTPLNERNLVQRHFKPLLKAAELPKEIRLYDLRHTCATLLLAAGENVKVVSERLGHATIKITLDTYAHVLPTMQQAASDKLANLLFSDENSEKKDAA